MNRCAPIIPLLIAAPAWAQQITVCADPAAPIAELAPATLVPIDVALPAGATVNAVSVELTLTHEWVGDLVVTIEKGAAQAVLLDRLSLGTFPFGCGGRDIDAVFTDSSVVTPESLCEPGPTPVIAGDVSPATPLSVFAGDDAAGVWTLAVLDHQHFDLGQIERVCLTIDYTVTDPPCPAADVADVSTTNTNPGEPGFGEPDGVIDGADLSFFVENWLAGVIAVADVQTTNTNPGDAAYGSPDGQVDGADLSYFVENWLAGCP